MFSGCGVLFLSGTLPECLFKFGGFCILLLRLRLGGYLLCRLFNLWYLPRFQLFRSGVADSIRAARQALKERLRRACPLPFQAPPGKRSARESLSFSLLLAEIALPAVSPVSKPVVSLSSKPLFFLLRPPFDPSALFFMLESIVGLISVHKGLTVLLSFGSVP